MVEKLDNTPGVQPTPHDATDDERVGFIFHDQRILDEACNLSCGYCAPSGFPMKIGNDGVAHMPGTWRETLQVTPTVDEVLPQQPQLEDFFALGRTAISRVETEADAKILK
ncbi:MAG TPA: hypothetical protein VFP32_04055, partial [Candidatus Saccharimonadales bacterium]|nr:hypothetical protein [Candidatus Saccharimonadales bacterium]